jgi:hypothetical protein
MYSSVMTASSVHVRPGVSTSIYLAVEPLERRQTFNISCITGVGPAPIMIEDQRGAAYSLIAAS